MTPEEINFYAAVARRHAAACEAMLSEGVSVKATGSYRQTPLHDAAEFGDVGICQLLLRHGADLECKDGNEDTPIHLAVDKSRDLAVCRLLVDQGADITDLNGM